MEKLRLRLVDGWHKGWKWVSAQALALGAAINGAWLAVPDDMKAMLPPKVLAYVSFGVFAAGFVGRFFTTAPKPDSSDASAS